MSNDPLHNNSLDEKDEVVPSNDQGTVVVGEGVRLEGRVENAKDTHIAGTYIGSVKSENISINNLGNLKGEIKAEDLTISGNFEGDIKVDKSMVVNSNAKVKGNIEYTFLEVKFGATIEGNLKHAGVATSTSQAYDSKENLNDNIVSEKTNGELS